MKKPFLSFGVLLWCFAQLCPVVTAQQAQSFSRDKLIAAAREIMTTTRYCALITADGRGRSDVRAMDALAPDENMAVWLGTNPLSRKVREIRRDPRVTLYYFDREGQAYVTLQGLARVVTDPAEKLKHWKEDWKGFYPDRGKSYAVIEVRPIRLEVVNVKTGIVSAKPDWEPPSVTFPTSTRRNSRVH